MTKMKKGLGRGLDVLLSVNSSQDEDGNKLGGLEVLNIDLIQAGKYQPRKSFDDTELQELANSIRENGVIQPIIVREVADSRYEIIAGERRYRASKLAGLDTIPVVIRTLTDEEALAFALIENIQRKDLNVIEEAIGYKRLIDEFGLTHEMLAKVTGKSRSNVSNTLRLLNLSEYVTSKLIDNLIDMGHARALLSLPNEVQDEFVDLIIKNKSTTAEVEKMVAAYLHDQQFGIKDKNPSKIKKDPDISRLEELVADKIGMTVNIKHNKSGYGKLTISYSSVDELEEFLSKVNLTNV
jgi:ParB family chromosome partitioning protein